MRILLITQYWEPENGVPQRRWAWLASTLEKAGHEILVVAPPPHYQRNVSLKEWIARRGYRCREEERDVSTARIVLRSGYVPGGNSITRKVLNQLAVAVGELHVVFRRSGSLASFQPDVVIGTVPAIPTAFVAAISAWRFKVPYIIDLRDAWPELFSVSDRWNAAVGNPSLRQRVLSRGPLQVVVGVTNMWLNRVLASATAVISTSSRLATNLQKRSSAGQKIFTVRNVFPPETLIVKQPRLSGPSDVLNVLYAGTLGRAQNLANALQAAKKAENASVQVRLRFVGAGAAKAELMEKAARLGVEATFEQRRSAELLQECYQWADTALVHLTDWAPLEEAVPSKTYELMNQGLHISGVVAGETAEIIRKLQAGDVVEPENPEALAQMWVNLAQNRSKLQLPETGKQWVHHQRETESPASLADCLEWAHRLR
ncbi:glycosyltransferase WbuB [Corynebacterium sp. NML 150383]|uniref:glycosyltransferase family 4 protein n=1 Tax=unclassified Corynebacterium TaxID=2624378 RepID=UPI000BAA8F4C|nr:MULTISPECIES: glycosyltransferase family 4 protein [unclassified Corynebacterium]PAT04029.1 glycosyltransferase WbuB [Corynebacterium sp. NML 150383]TVX76174.1 glycosyltransferase family 4 protein [Corynebacterium sp. NML180780]